MRSQPRYAGLLFALELRLLFCHLTLLLVRFISWTNEGCPGVHSSERADERFPWITVDVGASHLIHTVQIWNRGPCLPYSTYLCQSRLWKYAIYVGDVPPPQPLPEQGNYAVNTPCARQERGQPLGMYANVPCAATGRYVTHSHCSRPAAWTQTFRE